MCEITFNFAHFLLFNSTAHFLVGQNGLFNLGSEHLWEVILYLGQHFRRRCSFKEFSIFSSSSHFLQQSRKSSHFRGESNGEYLR